jgi:hypothetical protein
MYQINPEEGFDPSFKNMVASELQVIKLQIKGMESQYSALEAELKSLVEKLESLKGMAQGDTLSFKKY